MIYYGNDNYIEVKFTDIVNRVDKICIHNNLPRPNYNELNNIFENIFNCVYKAGFIFSISEYMNNFYCYCNNNSQFLHISLNIRSSTNNYLNGFNVGLDILIDTYNYSYITIEGRNIQKYIFKNGDIDITNGRRTVFHTQGKASLSGNWLKQTNDDKFSLFVNYLQKHYKDIILENSNNYKKFLNDKKLRELDFDEILSICDILTDSSKNIYAHFYDCGCHNNLKNYQIIINNDIDENSIYRGNSKLPSCQLASLKYFFIDNFIRINISKKEDNWYISIDYKMNQQLKNYILKYTSLFENGYYKNLNQFLEEFQPILNADYDCCVKMDNIWY